MAEHVSLYEATAGLVTMLDPQRLTPGGAEGPMELAECVNIAIDDRGLAELRHGGERVQEGRFHSLFCSDNRLCFVVREREHDAAIMRVAADGSLTGIRSGLTKGEPMGWCEVNGDVFYGNGFEHGFIREDVSHPWPVSEYHGPDADIEFTAAPVARLIGFRPGGQMLVARGQAIYVNHLPFDFGLWNLAGGAIGFDSDVRMLAMVRDGFFASDARRTWFFRKLDGWYHYQQTLACDCPALTGSLAHDRIDLQELGLEQAEGFGRVWASTEGIVLGMDDGNVIEMSKERVRYPRGKTRGACIIKDHIVLHTTW